MQSTPTVAAPTQAPNPALGQPKVLSDRIAVVGDSLVYGFGDPVGGGWVERLRRQFLVPGFDRFVFYNLGVRGDGVKQVAMRLEDEFRCRGELRNRVPDLLMLSVGVNDSPRLGRPDGRNFLAIDAFKIEMAELLDRAVGLCPTVFIGSVPVDETKMPFLDCLYYNHGDQYRYKEVTRSICGMKNIPYLDLFDLWRSRGADWCNARLSGDGLHPNSLGYATMLQDILAWEEMASRGLSLGRSGPSLGQLLDPCP
jgi:lysophospholipase L1-like esterase